MSNTVTDDAAFEAVAKEFAIDYLRKIAKTLHDNPSVDFDLESPSESQSELLFDLAFFGAIAFENKRPTVVGDIRYVPVFSGFSYTTTGGTNRILTGSALIHGLVDDPKLVSEALARAKAQIEK
ncbi:MAG: hypothetical protein JXQ99_05705 [Hyphomicrobiaceae bacterium]